MVFNSVSIYDLVDCSIEQLTRWSIALFKFAFQRQLCRHLANLPTEAGYTIDSTYIHDSKKTELAHKSPKYSHCDHKWSSITRLLSMAFINETLVVLKST